MPRTGLKPDEIKQRAIEIAKEHMRRFGYEKMRFSEVARDIGVSHAALYAHFADKSALLDAVSQAWVENMDAFLQDICDGEGSPIVRIRSWFLHLYRFKAEKVRHDPELFKAFDTSSELGKPFVCQHLNNLRRQMEGLLAEAIANGDIAPGEPSAIYDTMLDTTVSYYHPRILVLHLHENREEQLFRTLDVVLAGLGFSNSV